MLQMRASVSKDANDFAIGGYLMNLHSGRSRRHIRLRCLERPYVR